MIIRNLQNTSTYMAFVSAESIISGKKIKVFKFNNDEIKHMMKFSSYGICASSISIVLYFIAIYCDKATYAPIPLVISTILFMSFIVRVKLFFGRRLEQLTLNRRNLRIEKFSILDAYYIISVTTMAITYISLYDILRPERYGISHNSVVEFISGAVNIVLVGGASFSIIVLIILMRSYIRNLFSSRMAK